MVNKEGLSKQTPYTLFNGHYRDGVLSSVLEYFGILMGASGTVNQDSFAIFMGGSLYVASNILKHMMYQAPVEIDLLDTDHRLKELSSSVTNLEGKVIHK